MRAKAQNVFYEVKEGAVEFANFFRKGLFYVYAMGFSAYIMEVLLGK